MAFTHRYTVFALAHGRTPEAQLAHDKTQGASMCDFMIWIGERWRTWRALRVVRAAQTISEEQHADFDAWISEGCA